MAELRSGENVSVTASTVRATLRWSATSPVDIDISCLLLGADGRVRSDADFVFYNQPEHASGAARHTGKTPGVDTVEVNLPQLETVVDRVVVAASADGGSFGQVPGLSLHLQDVATGAELVTFAVTAAGETALVAGEFYRRAGAWKFRAVGQGYAAGLAGLARDFGISVDDAPASPPATAAVAPSATPTVAPSAPPAAPPAPPAPPAISLKKQQLVDMEKRVAATAPKLLSLTKRAAVSLEKRGLGEHTARVALCLDISGSMAALYRSGRIQALAERVLALALRFDDDGEVDVFLFGRGGYQAEPITLDNHASYTESMLRMHKLEPSTHYAAAMELIRQHYFGHSGPRRQPWGDRVPVYVMFVTDGATMDRDQTRAQLTWSSFEPIFWQFMAIGRPGGNEFRFLQELDDLTGRAVDNADFFAVEDPAKLSDDQLFDLLMTEYPGWLTLARQHGMLPPA